MSWLVNGIPLHPLFVHAAVIALPVVGLLAAGAAWSTRLRTWLGVVLPALASLAFVAALLTKEAGEALAERVTMTPALSDHIEIADVAVAGSALLLVVTWGQWAWYRYRAGQAGADLAPEGAAAARSTRITRAISVVVTAVAVFAIVGMVIAGDTGARAVWVGRF